MLKNKFVHFFDELGIKDVPEVGGKNASLGEMYSHLVKKGLRVPNGFATTASAYNHFLESTGLKKEIQEILRGLDTKNVKDLMKRGAEIRKLIVASELPKDFSQAILVAYRKLSATYKMKNVDVAVRSSATAEDLPDASFAGQQETYLWVSGEQEVIAHVRRCWASR